MGAGEGSTASAPHASLVGSGLRAGGRAWDAEEPGSVRLQADRGGRGSWSSMGRCQEVSVTCTSGVPVIVYSGWLVMDAEISSGIGFLKFQLPALS